ncbi:MAG: hypothetical protein QW390_04965 [Candidatus Bathyarchaeia archaeon]
MLCRRPAGLARSLTAAARFGVEAGASASVEGASGQAPTTLGTPGPAAN